MIVLLPVFCSLLQVCTMRSEEKSLRNKINELQKTKKQFSEVLEIKQRTILQLKKVFYFLKFYLLLIFLTNPLMRQFSKQPEKAYRNWGKNKNSQLKVVLTDEWKMFKELLTAGHCQIV